MRRRQILAQRAKEAQQPKINPLQCLKCGFVAKSPVGLIAHMTKTKDHREAL